MAADRSRVEVGCLESREDCAWILESRFFPSKVGGKPAWLDLKNISIDLSCGICSNPCVFLCQVYAPIDHREDAHHRTIYVFACKDPSCCEANKSDNFKVFRCQLPRSNDFYPPEEPSDEPDWHPESKIERFNDTCAVCGCLGAHRCGRCKSVKYCSRSHQISHWKSGHSETCARGEKEESKNSNVLFPEYEIVIESESCDEDDLEKDGSEIKSEEEKAEKSDWRRYEEFRELLREGKAGSLQDVPCEKALEDFALGKEDKYYNRFKARLSLCPDQVLRYDRGGVPLWIAKPNLNSDDVPFCENCNGPRQFEFQILPTLLSFLEVKTVWRKVSTGAIS